MIDRRTTNTLYLQSVSVRYSYWLILQDIHLRCVRIYKLSNKHSVENKKKKSKRKKKLHD